MALQGSGAISFSQIQTEMGGSNPSSLSEYYRAGGLVANIGQNGSTVIASMSSAGVLSSLGNVASNGTP